MIAAIKLKLGIGTIDDATRVIASIPAVLDQIALRESDKRDRIIQQQLDLQHKSEIALAEYNKALRIAGKLKELLS